MKCNMVTGGPLDVTYLWKMYASHMWDNRYWQIIMFVIKLPYGLDHHYLLKQCLDNEMVYMVEILFLGK